MPYIYSIIQDALDEAEDSDTVEVSPGIYTESIYIDVPNLTIKATEGREVTIVDAGGAAVGIQFKEGLNNITVDGFAVRNWVTSGIMAGSVSNAVLKGNHVSGDSIGGYGIVIQGGGLSNEPPANDNMIEDNIIENCGVGIIIRGDARNTLIMGNVISSNAEGVKVAVQMN